MLFDNMHLELYNCNREKCNSCFLFLLPIKEIFLKITILSVFLMLLSTAVTADDYSFIKKCNIPYAIMLSIAHIEREKNHDVGYPYMISFNNYKDYLRAKKAGLFSKVKDMKNKRNVDCLNKKECTRLVNDLLALKIDNIDIGAFQLNVRYHKIQTEDYFSLEREYLYACDYINTLVKGSGKWDWETVARYHSSLKSKNVIYQKLLKHAYLKLTKE